jgi:hypothetical protein
MDVIKKINEHLENKICVYVLGQQGILLAS